MIHRILSAVDGFGRKIFRWGIPLAGAVLCAALPAAAQRDLKDIPPPDPELERQSFEVAEGFEVNLFAADPKIAKPIQMNFDPQGRLWIASSEVYPHIKPGQVADDRVLVVEDRDGDGVSDKTTAFADGLLIPTGIAPGDGGVYVGNSTELLHLSDTDGDGKADRRRIVLSGFGTEDTHHIIHTLRWGPEGLLYFNQSIYIHSHIETPYGVRRLNGGGVWQFRPETMRLDVFARGLINPWGLHFDDWGQTFATDGAGGEGINYIVPGAAYPTAVGVSRILHGLNPGSPKHCGLEVVGGRHLPDDWQGNLITNDFRGHRVCRFVLSEAGSGYISRELPELIKSSHVAFRPVDVKLGPDGAIYIADWYNPIIQHGEVDFRDPRRDHTHGRIWRVTYKGRPTVPRPELVGAPVEELLGQLKSPEPWTRHQAKRVLKERGRDAVLSELGRWVKELEADGPLTERHRLEALWLYQAFDVVEPQLLGQLLRTDDHRVRAAATRVVQHWQDRLKDPLGLLRTQVHDDHPRVRLEAVRALGNIARPESIEIAMQALDRPVDDFLDYALWLTAQDLKPLWLPLVERGELDFDGNVAHLTFALKSVGSEAAVPLLIDLLETRKLSAAREQETVNLIAELAGPVELRQVFDLAARESADGNRRAVILQSLADAAERRKVRPAGDLGQIERWLENENPRVVAAAARCVGLWKLEALRPRLHALATSAAGDAECRRTAVAALAALGTDADRQILAELGGENHPQAVRSLAVQALATIDLPTAARRGVQLLSGWKPSDDPGALFQSFLQRKQGAAALQRALEGRTLPEDVAKIGLRIVESTGQQLPGLTAELRRAGGIRSMSEPLSPKELQKLVTEVVERGDPQRGEAVFRRSDLSCLKCHAIGGAGGRVGPDLISLGGSAQVDYLIESLLEPSKKIKENYHSVVVATVAGRVYSGIKVRQTDADLILRDAEDREISIPLEDIDEQAPGASLMPAGLMEKLTRKELVDLVRFLSELGRTEPFSIRSQSVVRRWESLDPTPDAAHRLRRTSYSSTTADDPAYSWSPVYSTVSGDLPLGDLPDVRVRNRIAPGDRGMAFVRFEMEATAAGSAALQFNSVDGLSLWVNDDPTRVDVQTKLEFPTGKHRLTLAVDLAVRRDPLRIELKEVPGSPARVSIVGGK